VKSQKISMHPGSKTEDFQRGAKIKTKASLHLPSYPQR